MIGLCCGLGMLFCKIRVLQSCVELLRQTRQYMDASARKRLIENRQLLQSLQQEHSIWFRLDRQLYYSGLKRRFPGLTVENWIAGNIIAASVIVLLSLAIGHLQACVWGSLSLLLAQMAIVLWGKMRAMRSVTDNLMKFLDFLGNYSITAGEITGIFRQVSRYVEEPLKGVLDECYYEAQTTGDTAMALLAMAEKVEHPKFKELVRNMEISIRYSADFTILVQNSRRTMREYLRSGTERKGLLREAVINMLLLLGLSFFIFLTVDGLIEVSVWHILLHSLPGKIALCVLAVIFSLFIRQIYCIHH